MFEAMKKTKKGQMLALNDIPAVVLSIGISAVIIGAVAITLAQFSTTTTNTAAIDAIGNGTLGLTTIANQFPTIGIIAVMAIIIGLISGVYMYFRSR